MENKLRVSQYQPTAERLQAEQAVLGDAVFSPQQAYTRELEAAIQEKHEQIERIEWGISELIEQTEEALERSKNTKPGFLTKPSTRHQWEQGIQKMEQRLIALRNRLDAIKEISETTGVHGPQLEQMAAKTVAKRQPELVEQWELEREKERKKIAEERANKKKENTGIKSQGKSTGLTLARGSK